VFAREFTIAYGGKQLSQDEDYKKSSSAFSITINFERHEGNPGRVFKAAYELIDAFKDIDTTLIDVVHPDMETALVLEDIERGSLKIWLRNTLKHMDDEAIKNLDWKPQIGQYLVKAKYVFIDLLNEQKSSADDTAFHRASKQITALASETDVKHLPDYKSPSLANMARSVLKLSDAKSVLGPNDTVAIKSVNVEAPLALDMSVSVTQQKLDQVLTQETITSPPTPMILRIKRPDYLGTSKWEFRHGKSKISAKILDENWLQEFHAREVEVRPGDSLRCKVEVETHYDCDNEVLSTTYKILRVLEVMEGEPPHPDLPFTE